MARLTITFNLWTPPGQGSMKSSMESSFENVLHQPDGLRFHMDIDEEKVEQTVLALLYLNTIDDKFGRRAWKGFPWSVMDVLHMKGYISNPATKNKSVVLTEKGARLSQQLFEKLFARK